MRNLSGSQLIISHMPMMAEAALKLPPRRWKLLSLSKTSSSNDCIGSRSSSSAAGVMQKLPVMNESRESLDSGSKCCDVEA
jgi:hypothetical protein